MWRETSVPASPKTAAAMRPASAEADCGEERLSQDTQYVRYALTRSTVGVHRGVDRCGCEARFVNPRRALDVAMGRGRHLPALASAGCSLFGVDINLDAVVTARRRGLPVRGWVADLTSFPLPDRRLRTGRRDAIPAARSISGPRAEPRRRWVPAVRNLPDRTATARPRANVARSPARIE